MSLDLRVDGDRWRAHLRAVAGSRPGLVPVVKGNGYGFGRGRLARRAAWLGVDTLAVGTYAEIPDVVDRFDGDVIVLTPWRPFLADAVAALAGPVADRLIHTVGRAEDLDALAAGDGRPRVLLERATSMLRHGFSASDLRAAVTTARTSRLEVVGVSLHLPLPGPDSMTEAEALLGDAVAAGMGPTSVWVSHLDADQVARLTTRYPEFDFRPRSGTDLWLGAPDALQARAHVLDTHAVTRGQRVGYRGRRVPRDGTVVVVSGGTAHGIGLEAPTGAMSPRSRLASVARGGLDAAGAVRSPFTVAGKRRFFLEPPHMQASMLFLPGGVEVPAVGDQVEVRVRHTATTFDHVVID